MSKIFERRTAFKPFDYPDLERFKTAINHSYWLVSEWNFVSDCQDFHVKLNDVERNAIKNTLLAISQIEISVKKFWTKLGERFPKAEFEQVGVTFGECHINGTEVLTPTGWVDFNTISVGDDVIEYRFDSTFGITKVLAKTDEPYSGQIHKFYKNTTEVHVTPNHRMLYFNEKGSMCETPASELSIKNSNNFLPEAGKLVGGSINSLTSLDRLKIALQADGNKRFFDNGNGRQLRGKNGLGAEYEIRILKDRKIKRLDSILENISGVQFTKAKIKSRPDMYCYTIKIDNLFDYKTFDWVNLYDKSSLWCEEFIQELSYWDGCRLPNKKDCKIKFSSTNKSVVDKAQLVGIAAGYRTNILLRQDNRKETYKDVYVLSFTSNREKTTLSSLKREIEQYTGQVRCITVPSGAIITRYNNKTFIAGNSEVRHADAYSHLLQVLNLNDDFALLLENPVIQGRVDYLTKYLKGAADSSNENYTLSLALFSMFIENVSLFSQFAIIKSFNKHRNMLKDVDNVVQATQKEETIHALLGATIIKHIQNENPAWFNDDFYDKIVRASKKAFIAECNIIDWIFEKGELSFLSKDTLKEFIKQRFNESLEMIGAPKPFDVDKNKLKELAWFNEEMHTEVNTDFFFKKPVTYSKRTQSIKEEDLF